MTKVSIVGAGYVGAATAFAMVLRGTCSELVLVDKNEAKARAEAADISHATPISHATRVSAGSYADLSGAHLVVLTAGANQRPGESRLELLARNAAVFREMVPQVLGAAPEATLLIATNPVDVMTQLSAQLAGPERAARVFGSGTVLDTARLRALIAAQANVDPQHVHGYVLGEHGDSEVVAWSGVTIAGLGLEKFMDAAHKPWNAEVQAQTEHAVRHAAAEIIAVKGMTAYGIGAALARITEAVLRDRRSVLTVSAVHGRYGAALSLPRVVGGAGLLETLTLPLSAAEEAALERSAQVLREAGQQVL
ncbi:L-lactate dehydrogenase [Deinococcus irradiatisoli]|uniref:L-lactate dehydrogenase n=1 Tax=Deinococcus irradiatisoli TaxID=2202254 RepID=A0A2Z3JBH9_9DEIO|nr:L-lactate dehydrogenase [Deinococcus irradiatisoli]AWN22493.1 L-lactate dehydrogenase [Deinococcus irradiatisoli]